MQVQAVWNPAKLIKRARVAAGIERRKRNKMFEWGRQERGVSTFSDPVRLCDTAVRFIGEGRANRGRKLLKKGSLIYPEDGHISSMTLSMHIERGDIGKAERVFRRMVKKGVAADGHFIAMIRGYSDARMPQAAGRLLGLAMELGIDTPAVLFAAQEAGLASIGRMQAGST